MKAIVTVAIVNDDGGELVGSHHEEVVVTTRAAEDNFLRAATVLERIVPLTHQQVRDQFSGIHEELEKEKAEAPRAPGRRR